MLFNIDTNPSGTTVKTLDRLKYIWQGKRYMLLPQQINCISLKNISTPWIFLNYLIFGFCTKGKKCESKSTVDLREISSKIRSYRILIKFVIYWILVTRSELNILKSAILEVINKLKFYVDVKCQMFNNLTNKYVFFINIIKIKDINQH